MRKQLREKIDFLPECYQPIYGHPEISQLISRGCDDRLSVIKDIYYKLENHFGRPLKVLDLGCAQGYFSFNLAEIGAIVTGIDYCAENISLCEEIKSENPDLNSNFIKVDIETYLNFPDLDQFDLVLGLSVFHHLVHNRGLEYVQNLTKAIIEKIPVGIFELALKEEPLYWAPYLPENCRDLLTYFPFVYEINRFKTHLSEIERPLIFASSKFWCLDGQLEEFESWTFSSHNLAPYAHLNTRRYFFSRTKFLKLYEIKYDSLPLHNLYEIQNEIHFFRKKIPIGRINSLLSSDLNEEQAWIILDRLNGRLLLELMQEDIEIDHYFIITNILKQLVDLETLGMYHNDVRLWNVIIQDDGFPQLIDLGSISTLQSDVSWPFDVFLSFLTFIYEVSTKTIEPIHSIRGLKISPNNFPEFYRSLIYTLWETPRDQWSFKLMYDFLANHSEKPIGDDRGLVINIWHKNVEEALSITNNTINELKNSFEGKNNSIEEALSICNNTINELKNSFEGKNNSVEEALLICNTTINELKNSYLSFEEKISKVEEARVFEAEKIGLQIQQLQNEIHEIYSCKSWRFFKFLESIRFFNLNIIKKTKK